MYPSTYLGWFRRLLILGAVVAGLTASAAGARLDPGTPPDVMTALHSTREGLKADGLRLQGIARTYAQLQSQATASQTTYPTWAHQLHSPVTASQYPTAAGLKADGLRYQGIARVYEQLQSNVPDAGGSDVGWSDWAIGVGAGIGIALLLGIGLVVGRKQHHRVQ